MDQFAFDQIVMLAPCVRQVASSQGKRSKTQSNQSASGSVVYDCFEDEYFAAVSDVTYPLESKHISKHSTVMLLSKDQYETQVHDLKTLLNCTN